MCMESVYFDEAKASHDLLAMGIPCALHRQPRGLALHIQVFICAPLHNHQGSDSAVVVSPIHLRSFTQHFRQRRYDNRTTCPSALLTTTPKAATMRWSHHL